MNPLTLQDLSQNAYRTLGLTAGATQSQIDSAARAMRLWDTPDHIPPTANDALFLGLPNRAKQQIEAAVARLADPERRVEERVWWFCRTPPEKDGRWAGGGGGSLARHDWSLLAAHQTMLDGTASENLDQWSSLIERFAALGVDRDYRDWLLNVEADGAFEKRASIEEVIDAQRAMRQRIASALSAALDKALGAYDQAIRDGWAWAYGTTSRTVTDMGRAVRLLRSESAGNPIESGADTLTPDNPAERLLDRMEDLLLARYAACEEHVLSTWRDRVVKTLQLACDRGMGEFDAALEPVVKELIALSALDENRRTRVRQQAASFLRALADGYDGAYAYEESERALRKAVEYGTGTALEATLRERWAKARREASQKELAGRINIVQPGKQQQRSSHSTPKAVKAAGGGGYGRGLAMFIGIIVIAVLRGLVATPPSPRMPSPPPFHFVDPPPLREPLNRPVFDIPDGAKKPSEGNTDLERLLNPVPDENKRQPSGRLNLEPDPRIADPRWHVGPETPPPETPTRGGRRN